MNSPIAAAKPSAPAGLSVAKLRTLSTAWPQACCICAPVFPSGCLLSPVALDAAVGPGADASLLWAAKAGPAPVRISFSSMLPTPFYSNQRGQEARVAHAWTDGEHEARARSSNAWHLQADLVL